MPIGFLLFCRCSGAAESNGARLETLVPSYGLADFLKPFMMLPTEFL
jgi:hypothetical protein